METITATILVSLALGLAAGFVMHRSDYCIAGMFRDYFLFRKTTMLRTLLLLVVVSMCLFEGARHLGLLRPYPFPLVGAPSLSNLVGGFIFGTGMVLAGGCVVGTLYKMGSGSVISLTAFVGLLAGSVLYAEIHPWWASLKKATTLVEGKVTVPQLLGVSPLVMVLAVSLPAAALFIHWGRGGWNRATTVEGYLQPWKAALALSVIGLASWVAIGMPMGITTAYSKWGAILEGLLFPGHVANLAYLQAMPLEYPHPWTGASLVGGPGPGWDAIGAIQYPLIGGIVLGAAVSAVRLGEFRFYPRVPLRQLLSGAAGGVLMGAASRMAPSCNVWHLLGGVPIFALQSLLFAAGLVPGAWAGTKLLQRYALPQAKGAVAT